MKLLFLTFLYSILAGLLRAQTTFYVDQSIQPANATADGSSTYPFSTLAAAFAKSNTTTVTTANIIFKGSSYTMSTVEAYTTTVKTSNFVLTLKPQQSSFTLKFTSAGQLSCRNYAQLLNEEAVKNVNISISGMRIETTSNTSSIFYGDCFFEFQDFYIPQINTSFLSLGNEGSAKMKNMVIANMSLNGSQSLYDQYSRERIEADYLTFDNVTFKNQYVNTDGTVYTMIRSFLQYKQINVTNSYMEGIEFSIKGEQIGGNNKSNITVTNTVMANAKTFFFIESYGVVEIKDCIFANATDRAIHFFLTDENLSPERITITNCTFENSTAQLEGAAIAFQGSKETSAQFDLNLLVTQSKFRNNSAQLSGGALAFLLLQNGNITIVDTKFLLNKAAEGGGALHVDKGESTMSFNLTQNTFDLNSAFTGGVFNFEFLTSVKITLLKNIYTNNLATFEGGIGFISESDVILKDSLSNGTANSADFEGGAWSIKGESQSITFENIRFVNTFAKFRGGCIFNSAANLILNTVTFENCSTSESGSSGGALFISEDAKVQGSSLTFNNNQAESGASLAFQSTQTSQQHTFTNSIFKFDLTGADITRTVLSQIQSDEGGLVFTGITITSLGTPFLSHTQGNIKLENVNIANLRCSADDNSITFCLFSLKNEGTDTVTFTLNNLNLQTVTSTFPLIVASGSTINLNTMTVTDVTSSSSVSVGTFDNCILSMTTIQLTDIDANFIQVSGGTQLKMTGGIFNNEAKRNDATSTSLTQFIVASESNMTIDTTSFKFNSRLNPTNGGAIRTTYPQGLALTHVNFTENKATNGGALYIEGSDITGNISHCIFSKNTVPNSDPTSPGFGGAIYMKRETQAVSSRLLQSTPSFLIENTDFQENAAYTGGGIYTNEANFRLNTDTFTANQAVSGGGLAIDIADTTRTIQILNSVFRNNSATLYGSSYLQLRGDVINSQNGSTFNDSEAMYSGEAPAKIKIRAFSVKESALPLNDAMKNNATALLELGLVKLEYDSFIDNYTLTLTNITSGGNLSRLVEISVHDASGTNLTELSGANNNVSLSIIDPVYPVNSLRNESSLAGITTKDFVNGSVTFLDEINIFAFPTSFLPIKITAMITHRDLGNLEYRLDQNKFNIQLLNCDVGEIFRKETLICDPCKTDYYSLTNPFTTSVCQKCDVNAKCPGGSKIYPNKGYWRINTDSDNIIKCPNADACLGGQTSEGFNLTGFCDYNAGYEGHACATCKPGYGKFGGDDQCTNCSNDPGYYVKLIVLLAIQIALIIFNVYSNLGLIHQKDKTIEKLTVFQSTVIKVLVDYAQVLGIVASIQITWPIGLGDFGSVVSKSVPSSKDAFSIDCFFSLAQGSNENVFFYKILILNIQPFLFFLLGTLFWLLITKIRRQSLHNNEQFKNNLLVTNCLIAYVLQPEIVKSTLQLFKCVNLGPINSEDTYLERDMEVQCGSPTHLAWALGIGVPSLVFWLVLPVMMFLRIMFRVSKFNDQETLDRYHFVFKRYKEDKIYWDLYIIIRKTALIFFLVFLNDLYSQIFFSFAVFIFSLHLHYKKEPYADNFNIEKYGKNTVSLNNLETLGLMSNCFLLFGGLFFIEEETFGVVHGFLMAIALLVNLIFLFRVLKAFWWVFRIKARIFIESKKKPKKPYATPENAAPENAEENQQIELPFVVEGENKDSKNTSMKKNGSKVDVHEESIKLFQIDDIIQEGQEPGGLHVTPEGHHTDDSHIPKERPTHHYLS